jgi:NTE family protein
MPSIFRFLTLTLQLRILLVVVLASLTSNPWTLIACAEGVGTPTTAVVPGTSAPASSKQRPTVALALGGGGTRGAAHIGVLRVLEQEGIPIDYIAGTSMGAIVGGLYDAKVPLSVCEHRAMDGSIMSHFMSLPISVRIAAVPLTMLPRLVGYRSYDGLYRGNHFRKYLVKLIPDGDCKIENLPIPFCAVVLGLRDGKIHALNSGSLAYAMQASSALPALRKPVQISDDLFIDGGVAANVPVTQAREMGADIVIAVNVDESFDEVPLKNFRKVGSVARRIVNWQLWYHDQPLCKQADVVIHPKLDGVGLLSRKHKDAKRSIIAGEEATRLAIPAIKARLAGISVSQNAPPDAPQTAVPAAQE